MEKLLAFFFFKVTSQVTCERTSLFQDITRSFLSIITGQQILTD